MVEFLDSECSYLVLVVVLGISPYVYIYIYLFVPLLQMAEVQPATPEAGYENLGSSQSGIFVDLV